MVAEVQYRLNTPDINIEAFGATIWVKFGDLDNNNEFLRRVAVWPVWDIDGGPVENEAEEISNVVKGAYGPTNVASGLVLRPAVKAVESKPQIAEHGQTIFLDCSGPALQFGIAHMEAFFSAQLKDRSVI